MTNEEQLLIAIKADTTNLMSGLKVASTGMENFNKKISGIGKGMTVAGAAITAGFVMAIKTASGFEQSMANTASVAGATAQELQRMSDAARAMGEKSVYSASQAADAMYYLGSAGLKADQIIGALEGTMSLAAATQSDLAFTSEAITATLAQYNLKAEEAGRVSNVFAAAISGSQATMEKLKNSMSYVGPVAKSLGMTLEDTTGILMNLYNAGLDGSKAGTSLRMAFAQLLDPSDKATAALDQMKVSITDSSGEMRPFKDIIDDLGVAGMTAGDAMDIFGKRAGPAMLALVSQGQGAIEKMTKAVTGTNKATEMAAIQMDTFQGSMKLLKSAFEEFQITLVQDLMPALRPFIENITEAITKTSDWIKENPELAATLAKVTAAIGALMAVVGPLLIVLPNIVTGLNLVKGAITPLNVQILLITGNIIIWKQVLDELNVVLNSHRVTIQDVQNAYEILARAEEEAAERMGITVEAYKQFKEEGKSVSEMMGVDLTPAVEEAGKTFDDFFEEVNKMTGISEILQPAEEAIQNMVDSMTPYEKQVEAINQKYEESVDQLKELIKNEEELTKALETLNEAKTAELKLLEEEYNAQQELIELRDKAKEAISDLSDEIYEMTHSEYDVALRDLNQEFKEHIKTLDEAELSEEEYKEAVKEAEEWLKKKKQAIEELKKAQDDISDSTEKLTEREKELIKQLKLSQGEFDKYKKKTIEAAEATKQLGILGGESFEGFTTQIKHATTALSNFTKEGVAAAIANIKMHFKPMINDLINDANRATGIFKQIAEANLNRIRKTMQDQIDVINYGLNVYNNAMGQMSGGGGGGSMMPTYSPPVNEGGGGNTGGGGGGYFGGSKSVRNTYSPSIVVNVSGGGNTADIKRAVQEALDESNRQYFRQGKEILLGA